MMIRTKHTTASRANACFCAIRGKKRISTITGTPLINGMATTNSNECNLSYSLDSSKHMLQKQSLTTISKPGSVFSSPSAPSIAGINSERNETTALKAIRNFTRSTVTPQTTLLSGTSSNYPRLNHHQQRSNRNHPVHNSHRKKTTKSHDDENPNTAAAADSKTTIRTKGRNESNSNSKSNDRRKRRKSSILPTLDASALFDPTLYIKRTARPGGTTSISGGDAAKRLTSGQELIRAWIQGRDPNVRGGDAVEVGEDGKNGNSVDDDDDDVRHGSLNDFGGGGQGGGRSFALVGHGVPMQLLQCCVDSAWDVLNLIGRTQGQVKNLNDHKKDEAITEEGTVVDVEECCFRNKTLDDDGISTNGVTGIDHRDLEFDSMRIRMKGGIQKSIPWPLERTSLPSSNNSNETLEDLEHNLHLYLIVMKRIASTFANALVYNKPTTETCHTTNNLSSQIKSTTWKAEILKGFVYPPSATIFSTAFWNDGEDCSSGQRIGDLTSPPIVELDYDSKGLLKEKDGNNIVPIGDDGNISVSHNLNDKRVKIWITLQGIPSTTTAISRNDSALNEQDVVEGRGLVPVSLAFEAVYNVEEKESLG